MCQIVCAPYAINRWRWPWDKLLGIGGGAGWDNVTGRPVKREGSIPLGRTVLRPEFIFLPEPAMNMYILKPVLLARTTD